MSAHLTSLIHPGISGLRNSLLTFICVFLAGFIYAQPLPLDPSIRIGKLENGLTYYLKVNKKPENKAALRIALKAGSIVEDEDQQGLAHFVEHMCFNGTKNFTKNEMINYLESVGTRFGPDLNAYTSFDETVYMLEVRTDDAEKLSKGLTVMEDWAGGVAFDGDEIDKERGVVVSEWRSRLSADQRMSNKYYPVMYKGSQYANRLPIGKPEIIENAPYSTVKRFYTDWYRPDLMAIIVVGDIDLNAMEKEVKTRFSKLTNPTNPRARQQYNVPLTGENAVSVVSDKEAGLSTVRVMYKHKNTKTLTKSDYRAKLVEQLYNSMLNQRLSELQRLPDPPFIFAYSGYGEDVGDLATYTSYAAVKETALMKGLETILTENERVKNHGFLESELERVKASMIKNAESAVLEEDKTESTRFAMAAVYHFLEDSPLLSAQQRLDMLNLYLKEIKLNEVNMLAAKWLKDSDRVVIVTAPEKEGLTLPTESDINTLIANVKKSKPAGYADDALDEPLLNKKLVSQPPATIQEVDETNTLELTYKNGVKVILKSTAFKNDEILFSAQSKGGTSLYSEAELLSARYAVSAVTNSGLGNFNTTQLDKKLSDKNVRLNPYLSETSEGFNGTSSPDDLETLLQLLYLYFTQPRYTPDGLTSVLNKERAFLQNVDANPNAYFSREMQKFKFGNHPRRMPTVMEDLDKVNGDAAFKIFRERFANAADFTFFFVGNIDFEKHGNLIHTYLANLPTNANTENYKDLGIKFISGKQQMDIKKGEAPRSNVDITYHGDFKFEGDNEYMFQSMLDVARIKLRESMREDLGGVYGVSLFGNTSRITNTYSITISFNADPDRTEELTKAAYDVIEKLKSDGPTELDITKVSETQRQSRIVDLEKNNFWIGRMTNDQFYGLKPNWHKMELLEKQLEKLSPKAIQESVSKYFTQSNILQSIVVPEKYVNVQKP